MSQLPERIKKIRKDNNLSQDAFAKILDVHRGHISKIETGAANASETLLLTICLEFDISWNWLNEGKGRMKAHWGTKELQELIEVGLIRPKHKSIYILFEVTLDLLDLYTKSAHCLGDDFFRLSDFNPGDPMVVEIVEDILRKLKSKAFTKSTLELRSIERSVLNILRSIDNNSLKDLYLFLALKAERLEKGKREKLKKDIATLKKALK